MFFFHSRIFLNVRISIAGFLPKRVSFNILLHWMAKDRSELSKMVIRSSSGREQTNDTKDNKK